LDNGPGTAGAIVDNHPSSEQKNTPWSKEESFRLPAKVKTGVFLKQIGNKKCFKSILSPMEVIDLADFKAFPGFALTQVPKTA